jgi:hypothetical protein
VQSVQWLAMGRGGWNALVGTRFFFSPVHRLVPVPIKLPLQWAPRALSLEVKWLRCEVDHSTPTSANVKNTWSYISTPPYIFIAPLQLLKYVVHPIKIHSEQCKWVSVKSIKPFIFNILLISLLCHTSSSIVTIFHAYCPLNLISEFRNFLCHFYIPFSFSAFFLSASRCSSETENYHSVVLRIQQ